MSGKFRGFHGFCGEHRREYIRLRIYSSVFVAHFLRIRTCIYKIYYIPGNFFFIFIFGRQEFSRNYGRRANLTRFWPEKIYLFFYFIVSNFFLKLIFAVTAKCWNVGAVTRNYLNLYNVQQTKLLGSFKKNNKECYFVTLDGLIWPQIWINELISGILKTQNLFWSAL